MVDIGDPFSVDIGTLACRCHTLSLLAKGRQFGEAEVQRAVDFAEAGHWEPVEDLLRDVTTPVLASGRAPGVPP